MTVGLNKVSELNEPSRFKTDVNVAGIGFELSSACEMSQIGFAKAYSLFGEEAETTISIDLKFENLPDSALNGAREVFASESLWTCFHGAGAFVFALVVASRNELHHGACSADR